MARVQEHSRRPGSGAEMFPGVPVELDMEDIKLPLTRERVLSIQGELLDKLSEPGFQALLRDCEHKRTKGSLACKREHQQLLLGVQCEVIPKYGFDASIEGVGDMLAAVKAFQEDPEVAANTEAIMDIVHGKPASARGAASIGVSSDGTAALRLKQREWQAQPLGRPLLLQQPGASGQGPKASALQAGAGIGCELDMDDIHAPLEREAILELQQELLDRLGAPDFQARLRDCAIGHSDDPLESRRAHQQLVLEVQRAVLPKYGFDGSLQGVMDLLAALTEHFSSDAAIVANVKAIDCLIWGPAGPPQTASKPATATPGEQWPF